MSAIAGVVHLDGSRASGDVEAMLDAMAHRWPDGRTVVEAGPATFGFGLMATTPEASREALPLEGTWLVTADARVDNRDEMLAALGLAPGTPDGDIVQAAVQRWGIDAADRLVGDFAWAAWDEGRRRLMMARDFLGLRPLYYHCDGRRVAFASELRGLRALPWVPRDVDHMRVLDWRIGRYGDSSNTFMASARRVPAAHVLVVDAGGLRLHRYWDPLQIQVRNDMPLEEAVAGVRHHFREAVRSRMRSNGPLAAHLSGGLDSSSVVATARDLDPSRPVNAYTLKFSGDSIVNERPFAQAVADQSGAHLHQVESDRHHPWWKLEERVRWADGPLVTIHSSYVIGMIAEAARRGERVVLDGSEGDDVIGHGEYLLLDHLRALRLRAARRYVAETAERYRGTAKQRLVMFGIRPLTQGFWTRWWLHRAPAGRGLFARETPVGGPVEPELLPLVRARLRQNQPRIFRSVPSDAYNRAANLREPIFDELTNYLDHTYAALGMEHRSPFFDRRLVDFCLTVPTRHRQQGGETRYYFRQAMADILPAAVARRQDKAAFDRVSRLAAQAGAPTGVELEKLNAWQWPEMPGLFASRVDGQPSVLVRKRVLQCALENLA